MKRTGVRNSLGVAALVAAGLALGTVSAGATSAGPRDEARIGDTPDRVQVREHDRIRNQQVRQTENTPLYRTFFAPLYEGGDSPWQRVKRAFN